MKKLFFLFVLFAGVTVNAQVSVSNMQADYAAKKITFTVSWSATPESNKIWLLADYRKIENNAETGNWSRAPIAAATRTAGVGSASTVAGNAQGFWLNTAGSSGSATVAATLTLPVDVEHFNWCAYAFNYPPSATVKAGGGYDLHGTPPFTVNGEKLAPGVMTFGAGTCITSITDATDNPAGIIPPAFSAGSITTASTTTTPGTAPTVTVANAIPASGGDGDITYQWRRSGTSSATLTGSTATYALNTDAANYSTTGTYYFTRWAHENTCNTSFVQSDGAFTLTVVGDGCSTQTLTLKGIGFSSTAVYTINGVKISSAVTVTTCQKSTYDDGPSGSYASDCRTNPSYAGDLLSGCMVLKHASELCPHPWRVPTRQDICKIANGSITQCDATTTQKSGMNGWQLGGWANAPGTLQYQGIRGCYIIDEVNPTYTICYTVDNEKLYTSANGGKAAAYTLRCVQ
jgi:hypothetical protein